MCNVNDGEQEDRSIYDFDVVSPGKRPKKKRRTRRRIERYSSESGHAVMQPFRAEPFQIRQLFAQCATILLLFTCQCTYLLLFTTTATNTDKDILLLLIFPPSTFLPHVASKPSIYRETLCPLQFSNQCHLIPPLLRVVI